MTDGYDHAGRLTSACPATGTGGLCTSGSGELPGVAYTYDAVGNRQTQAVSSYGDPAAVTNYSYDVADELTSAATPKGTIDDGYDKAGNQTSTTPYAGYDGTVAASRTFDATDHVLSTTLSTGATVSSTYDAAGNRMADHWPTYTTSQTWDTNGSLPALTRTDTAGDFHYRWHNAEWLGPVGRVRERHGRLPADRLPRLGHRRHGFGRRGPRSGQDHDLFAASPIDPSTLGSGLLGFAGREIGPDGTYDNQARTYDPSTGSFTGQDPASDPTVDPFVSAYIYANDSPLSQTDPSGRAPQPGTSASSGRIEPGNDSYHNYALGHGRRASKRSATTAQAMSTPTSRDTTAGSGTGGTCWLASRLGPTAIPTSWPWGTLRSPPAAPVTRYGTSNRPPITGPTS